MKKTLMTAMTASISEVMETMFFLPVEFGRTTTLAATDLPLKKSIACSLSFCGDTNGQLILVAPKELTREMAVNFMGESQDKLTDDHLIGTLTEMLNMVCGNALSKVDASVPYELDIPERITLEAIGKDDMFITIETTESNMAAGLVLQS